MSRDFRYGALIDAERNAEIPPANAERDWKRIQGSLRKGRPPLPVSALPLGFGAVLFATKAAAMAVALGATAAGAGWFYRAELGLASWHAPSKPTAPSVRHALPRRGGGATKPNDVADLMASASPTPAESETRSAAPAPRATRPQASSSPASSSPASSSPASSSPASSSRTPTIPDVAPSELELIGWAKRDVDHGSPSTAQRWLREHARLYPHGILELEREALTVVAACSASRGGSAKSSAHAFLRRYPDSIYRDRVERACHLLSDAPTAASNDSPLSRAESRDTTPNPDKPSQPPVDRPGPSTPPPATPRSEASFPAVEP